MLKRKGYQLHPSLQSREAQLALLNRFDKTLQEMEEESKKNNTTWPI
jgi:hypothetical protein